MSDQQTSQNNTQNIAQAIQEVSERAQLLVREEIELAKAEVTAKLTKLIKGAVVAIAASVFVIAALALILHGLSWLAWYEIFGDTNQYFWGFFIVAGVLFLLGALAGFIAARAFKAGAPPKPAMAIDEAKLIRETVQSSHPEQTV